MTKTFLLLTFTYTLLSANCLEWATDIEVGECYEKEGNTHLAKDAFPPNMSDPKRSMPTR